MVNQQVLAHHWDEIRDRLREKYERLSDEDLPSFPGNIDQLIGRIHQKTGVSREAVEAYLADLSEEGQAMAENVRQKVQEGAAKLSETARQSAQAVREGYAEAGDMISQRPGQSMLAAFGLGMVCGLGVALLLKNSRPEPATRIERGRASAERIARQIRESLASHGISR